MKLLKRLELGLILMVAIIACSTPAAVTAPTVHPPNTFTEDLSTLDTSAITAMAEIAKFVSTHDGVIQVAYASDTNRVLAAYEDGYIIGWDGTTTNVVLEHDLKIASSNSLNFNISSTMLLGATESLIRSNKYNPTTEYINGIALWNVETGDLIRCITYPCQDNPLSRDGYIGAAIDPTGQWVLVYSESTVDVSNLSGTSSHLHLINNLDADYQWNIGAVAVDAIHKRYAIILQEGGVWLDTLDSTNYAYHILADGQPNDLHAVLDAKFDPGGQRLAVIRDDILSVWQLARDSEKELLHKEIPDAFTLTFDQEGKLLIVGVPNKIIVWDLEKQDIIAEYDTLGITSLTFSQDNRLVIWGDVSGAVHIWGVVLPKSE